MRATRNQKYRLPEALICHLCQWEEPEMREQAIKYLMAMQLNPITKVRFDPGLPENEIQEIAHHLDSMGELPKFVQSVVVANEQYEGEDVETLRQQILLDYSESVFSNRHNKDPPVRGPLARPKSS